MNKVGDMMHKTSLYEKHLERNAHMTEFAGFNMPLFYSSISNEHQSVRTSAGIFDISHMGEILVTGPDAQPFVNHIVSNFISLETKKVTYALLCNQEGFVIDDLLVYVLDKDKILLVVNASNIIKDFDWIVSNKNHYAVNIRNLSDDYSQLAIQGPKAHEKCESIFDLSQVNLHFMEYTVLPYQDDYVIFSRTGYTGEDGYEIYGKHALIQSIWDAAIDLDIVPCGLGCRDTLRFEAALPLYGHELSTTIHPFEAGLGFAVKDTPFIGSKSLEVLKAQTKRKLVGIKMLDRGIPRATYEIYFCDDRVGEITTGYQLPNKTYGLALALIDKPYHLIGTKLDVFIRNKRIPIEVIKKSFMQKKYIKES